MGRDSYYSYATFYIVLLLYGVALRAYPKHTDWSTKHNNRERLMPKPRIYTHHDFYKSMQVFRNCLKGHALRFNYKGEVFVVHPIKEDDKLNRQIAKKKQELAELEAQKKGKKIGRRPYIKRNKEHWARGGNANILAEYKRRGAACI